MDEAGMIQSVWELMMERGSVGVLAVGFIAILMVGIKKTFEWVESRNAGIREWVLKIDMDARQDERRGRQEELQNLFRLQRPDAI